MWPATGLSAAPSARTIARRTALIEEGHIEGMCRAAVAAGVSVEDAFPGEPQRGRLPRARGSRRDRAGVSGGLLPIRCGRRLPAGARLQGRAPGGGRRRGAANRGARLPPGWLTDTVRQGGVSASDFAVRASGVPVRVIELVPDQLIKIRERVAAGDRWARAGGPGTRPGQDRGSSATTRAGGSGSDPCAASACARARSRRRFRHDAHNAIVVGASDDDMALCVQRLAELEAGSWSRDGAVLAEPR